MHNLLADYISELSKQLQTLPQAKRTEELREMRQHLLNAATVYREQGQSEDEAMQSAIAQFGIPSDVGGKIVQSWRRGQILSRRDLWKSAVCVLLLVFVLPEYLINLYIPFIKQTLDAHQYLLPMLLLVLPYLLVGLVNGIILPRRTMAGVCLGIGVWIIYALITQIIFDLHLVKSEHYSVSHVLWIDHMTLIIWGMQAFVAVSGTWLGSRGRGRVVRLANSR